MSVLRLILTDAIKALPSLTTVQYSLWVPLPGGSLPSLAQGSWAPWVDLPRPYTTSKPTDASRKITVAPGGEEYIKALAVYCATGLPPELIEPMRRGARIRCSYTNINNVPVYRDDDVYKVMEVRTWDQVSDHAEIHCRRDLGEAKGQV